MPETLTNNPGWRRWVVTCVALGGLQSLVPAGAGPGQALFERQCQPCHRGGPATLDTPASDIATVLRGGTIRPHRFQLDDNQLRELQDYLTEVKADGR